jgi:hypothetical protein
MADGVVHRVAQNRRRHQDQNHPNHVEGADGGHGPYREQERVARQDRRHDQAGFAEDDDEENRVHPEAVVGAEHLEMLVDMQDEVDQEFNSIHRNLPIQLLFLNPVGAAFQPRSSRL